MLRQAVSILLTRDPGAAEAYLVERSPELKFFGGYFAFAGGTVDEEDAHVAVQNAASVPGDSLRYLVAAAREMFEETGILFVRNANSVGQAKRNAYRRQLLAKEISFTRILQQEGLVIDANDFHHICSILTPEFSPVRYDTQFYWAKIPEGAAPEIWPGELVRGGFYSAEEALTLWRRGELLIVPPVIFMLKELRERSVETFTPPVLAYAESYRQGKIHQVYFSPGVQLVALPTRTLFPATHTNTYLVGERELYIVDPAPSDPREQERLWNYLDDLIAQGQRYQGILLTHHHSDHLGALVPCQKRYKLPVFAHRNTAEKLPHVEFAGYLNHGDELDLGQAPDGSAGWKLKVYYTPGHASGHVSFRENRYGAVIAGDLISTVSTIVISPPDGHLATYLDSLRLLETVTSGMLYPGHGPAVRQGKAVVQYYLKHRLEREEKLIAALSEHPQTPSDLVKKVYDDVDPRLWPLAEHSLLAGLIKLEEEGQCCKAGNGFVVD
ncbi:MAG: MBL fold metallo-hydrolase [bacterium]